MSSERTMSSERRIRSLLTRTWHPFFARFGRLTPIQRQAIPPLSSGEATLLSAPTASGKTEALIAPLLERLLDARAPGEGSSLGVVLVAPTRALCNDLHRRLRAPVKRCRLKLARKTADAPRLDPERLPDLLITTPESLDSLITRHPASLRSLSAVAIDELHLLARSARGDQLRCLLARLDALCEAKPLRAAASATLPDARSLAFDFLGQASRVVHDADAARSIEATLRPAAELDAICDAIAELHAEAPRRKILVFANTRAQTEQVGAQLAERLRPAAPVFIHHGSLARSERLRVEAAFLDAPSAVCVATMTLELGVDIGDIDRTVLLSPPPDVTSLLQRVGRGNRSEDVTHVLALYASGFEAQRLDHLLDCARHGRLFPDDVGFRPTVLAQQALSLLFQNPKRWTAPRALHRRLPPDVAADASLPQLEALFHALVDADYLRPIDGARYVAEPRTEKLYEYGQIHSMIADAPALEVVDAVTGRAIGTLPASGRTRSALHSGAITLGGRDRSVQRVQAGTVYVRDSKDAGKHLFAGREAPRYTFGLAQDLARHLDIPEHTLRLERLPDGRVRLGHFLGTTWGRLFDAVLARLGVRSRSRDAFFLELKRPPDSGLITSRERVEEATRAALERGLQTWARLLQPGPFLDVVPESMLRHWIESSLQPERFIDHLTQCRLVNASELPPDA